MCQGLGTKDDAVSLSLRMCLRMSLPAGRQGEDPLRVLRYSSRLCVKKLKNYFCRIYNQEFVHIGQIYHLGTENT